MPIAMKQTNKKTTSRKKKSSIMQWRRSPGSLQRAEKATATVARDRAHEAECQ